MCQWTDEMSQARSTEEQTVHQEAGATNSDFPKAGLSSFHSSTDAEVGEAFGSLPREIPLSIDFILDPVHMINFGNVFEMGKSIH